jgi:2-(1,2-epoxy-1,2-dihydrophenyl)acetyl-CoA isomerase
MVYKTIIYKNQDSVATITLNRTDTLNSVNSKMCEEFLAAIDTIENGNEARVLIIAGAGRGFCSGADVGELAKGSLASGINGSELVQRLYSMKIPTIAMVNGVAAGGGACLALACDMRIGSENARFINAFVRIGLSAGWGGAWLYQRAMGVGKALEILLTGDALEAKEAYRVGALNKLVPADELETETMILARKLADGPPLAIWETKKQVYQGIASDLETALERSNRGEVEVTIPTEDHLEGIAANREKRKPVFKGK